MRSRFEDIGEMVGTIVAEKNAAYGDAFGDCGKFLELLYPRGVSPEDYRTMLTIVRIYDKLKRAATRPDAFGESPFFDIAGYAILEVAKRKVTPGAPTLSFTTPVSPQPTCNLQPPGVTF
jgi:hypothetical protein